MEIGKVPHDLLQKIVFQKLKNFDEKVKVSPGIGEDCAILDIGEQFFVLSCDPITGTAKEIGKLAVYVSCNDIASSGVRPLWLLVTILLPPESTEEDLDKIMADISETAASLNVSIIGGHTEVTDAVTRIVINTTAIGMSDKNNVICSAGAAPGDKIIMTKTAAIEGTAIIAFEKENELKKEFGDVFVKKAQSEMSQISVIAEGVTAGDLGADVVHSMHDITEGGLYGALWEIAEAAKTGVIVYEENIPITEETKKICEFYNLNPYRLISSGSMVMTTPNPELVLEKLNEKNIPAAVVGEIVSNPLKRLIYKNENQDVETMSVLRAPKSDELYKLPRD
ncbi:Thiamine-monophosphate kinase [Methanimicrococcus hongohii]|uniref:Thiamine-monophosphate kinase n=1 Tax=Methanimicrococcus hongohii TaxID=3028295 RepID=A0AA96ZT87_9EURY|nr:AIR synthase family protein [Methanimicrococcus sp. Hf6]WNY24289.1 Thiamine-monophosphate kinase [Methanimicrococcus sp. Hf6]